MILAAHEIKRQILAGSSSSPVKSRIDRETPGISSNEMIEIGNELEKTTKTAGWTVIETYMMARMNLVGLATQDGSDIQRGIARAFIELMQYVDLAIKRRNQILEEERAKHEAKNVPKDEINEGV